MSARVWLYGILTALGVCLLGLAYSHGRSVEDAEWQARWNKRMADEQSAQATAQGSARTEEQRRQKSVNEVANDARTQQVAALDDAGRAADAGDRLRVAANELAERTSCASSDSGVASRGEAARRSAMVLSDMLSRADKRAGELAAAYDRARIAGLACERAYSALSP